MKKLTIIGGGSVRAVFFANSLAKRADELNITKLCLYDNDPEKLRIIGTLAKYAASKINPGLEVELQYDADTAIAGTDYIVTTIRVGGDHTRVADEEIAAKFGVLGQETTGVGGFFMAARSIPVLIDYCEKIKHLAPKAWIFNFSNPSGLVTQALRSLGYDRVIGICDTPSSTKLRISEAMGYDNEKFYLEFFGLNHLSWARRAEYGGKDVISDILYNNELTDKVGELGMFDSELLSLIGHVPNEYLYYYYYRDKAVRNILSSGLSRGREAEANNIEMLAKLRGIDLDKDPETGIKIYLTHMYKRKASYMQIETTKSIADVPENLEMPDGEGYAGIALDFASAVESGKKSYIVLSVPNNGSMDGLMDDDVIEVTCAVDEGGAAPVRIGKVGDEVFSLIKSVKTYERLSVDAILNGSVDSAVRALMAHPLIGSYETSSGLVNEFIAKQGEYSNHWK